MSNKDAETEQLRERLPNECYVAKADFVQLSVKEMTARRMVGWLREYAEYCKVAGADKTAEHAHRVSNRLASELPDEFVEEWSEDSTIEQ